MAYFSNLFAMWFLEEKERKTNGACLRPPS